MFQKFLASVGIGNAKVDTVLEKDEYLVGEEIVGVVHITGGSVNQQIESIYLTLSTSYIREVDDKKVSATFDLERVRLTEPITISPNEKVEIPFSFSMPIEAPLTFGMKTVWVHTGLDIKHSIDPSDRDYIQVLPNVLLNSVLDSVKQLGFRLHQAEREELPRHLRANIPFAQEFEFIPVSGQYYGKLDELELLILPRAYDRLDIVMEVDRKARGLAGLFSEALDLDERVVRFTVTREDIPTMQQKINSYIS
ncbi:sporulation protein [Bacillus pseudomycoides]|uniref:sporulation protein n=1 Tax=Bacillus pseudomycoides TaxID=64104 RepID=UPI000BED11B5|nr:sporulation protein [Bacillus pseudomycoides]PEE40804.1 sporulation protein SpoOM [Bacillus pseudomycoides]PGA81778.1 sporulation protein SpoOM [Bacillus pseudomycoides]PHF35714.1 sporulation protein SpoOM [Bacillus pseudomycoides]